MVVLDMATTLIEAPRTWHARRERPRF